MTDINYIGIATLISSVTAAGSAVWAIVRQGRMDSEARKARAGIAATVAVIKSTVDGLGSEREAMALRAGTAEGHAAGVADERAAPQSPVGS